MTFKTSDSLRGAGRLSSNLVLAFISLFLLIIAVKAVLVDVVDNLVRDVVANALASLAEESNLGG